MKAIHSKRKPKVIFNKEKHLSNRLPLMTYYYILYTMTHRNPPELNREIKCEGCESYEKLELHHNKYSPCEKVTIDDIRIFCSQCHRNDKKGRTMLRTIFENGKRYCVGAYFKFEY